MKPAKISAKKFAELTKAEQRITVAKDILARISREEIKPTTGAYLKEITAPGRKHKDIDSLSSLDVKTDLKEVENCDACVLGSIFISLASIKNSVTYGDMKLIHGIPVSDNTRKLLLDTFSTHQLLLIEAAFERYSSEEGTLSGKLAGEALYGRIRERCEIFYDTYKLSEDRLVAIMTNIVKNKGTFKP